MRIVTRVDFDSVVCAVILFEALDINKPVKWIEPNEMQQGRVDIEAGDIIANLPYHEKCSMWFDHHYSNKIDVPFEGVFRIAPSAAGVIYDHYKDKINTDFSELIHQTDRIDAAELTEDEVKYPEKYPYVILSMTLSSRNKADEPYWNRLIDLLRNYSIGQVMDDPEVAGRCDAAITENKLFKKYLEEHTVLNGHVAVTDFRSFTKAPNGNRFLSYSLFPESIVNVKIRYDQDNRDNVILSVGHSIFNRKCIVNVGAMLSQFNGGGHKGAGACKFHKRYAEEYIGKIVDILSTNEKND